MSTVDIDDVKQLMTSDREDPVLVLLQGQPRVIAAHEQDAEENRGALFVPQRPGANRGPGRLTAELERLATILSDMADLLGA